MKPSEYLYNEDFMVLNDTYKLKIINKLDKRFIDRKELKEKLKPLFKTKYPDYAMIGECVLEIIDKM